MKLEDLRGRITPVNIVTLQKYVKKVADKHDHVVVIDIGTLAGKSAIVMAKTADNVEVLTVDPRSHPLINEQIKAYGVEDRVKYFEMTEFEFGENHCPNVIHACFIDGRHGYPYVKHSIDHIVTKMVSGGYAMFHDVNLYRDRIGKAIDERMGELYEDVGEFGLIEGVKAGSIYVVKKI